MSNHNGGQILRWAGWSLFWVLVHPEIVSLDAWAARPESIAPGIAIYIFTGVILELCYRKFVWGRIRTSSDIYVACPECKNNPWIPLLEKKPDHESKEDFELFCIDGVVRPGVIVYMQDKGYLLATKLTSTESVAHGKDSGPFRPTHWRYCKVSKDEPSGAIPE